MNFFGLIAVAMAGYIVLTVFTGKVYLRGEPPVVRHEKPQLFWLYVAAFTVGLVITIAEAISPPY